MSAFYLQVRLRVQWPFLVSFNQSRKKKCHISRKDTAFAGLQRNNNCIFLSFIFSDESIVLPTIIVGTLVIVFGLPFFSVANVSLYSKITDEKTQGKSSNTCLTARAYLNTQKYGLFCSLDCRLLLIKLLLKVKKKLLFLIFNCDGIKKCFSNINMPFLFGYSVLCVDSVVIFQASLKVFRGRSQAWQ